MTAFYHEIEDAEHKVEEAKNAYLRRFGWSNTCSVPGSFWMWRRDFADEDVRMAAIIAERKLPSPHHPYGVITATTDVAVRMTVQCLDEQEELASEEAY